MRNVQIKAVAVAIVVTLTPAAVSRVANAVDNGAWQVGCATGKTCFRTGTGGCTLAAGGDQKLASVSRDSNFSNDYFGSSLVLNDNAYCMWNRNTVKVRAYRGADYDSSLGALACVAIGGAEGPYPVGGNYNGVSSFKSC